jgi:small neutral amino acid transporter SnatA (MarC family)
MRVVTDISFRIAVGALAAKSLRNSWGKAVTYVIVDLIARLALAFYCYAVLKYSSHFLSKKKRISIDIASRVVGCLSGILATYLICNQPINLVQAFIVQVASHDVVNFVLFKA